MKNYQILSRALGAKARCEASGNVLMAKRWQKRLDEILGQFPSGSGYDQGTSLASHSTPEKLVFETSFHHMDDSGYYIRWTHHLVIVKPSLEFGFHVYISGRDYREIKDLIASDFGMCLELEQPEFEGSTTLSSSL